MAATPIAAAATAVMASWLQSTSVTVTVRVCVTKPSLSGPTLARAAVAETTTEAVTQATTVRKAAAKRRG